MTRDPDPPPDDLSTDDEPEPDWAQQIRDLRRARGERLKEQLAGGDDGTPQGHG